jgi:archaellum component FlaC
MGMAIADNIDFLNDAKKLFEDIANNPGINETVKTHFTIESLESAIDIMRKYQKIEQALNSWHMHCINDREFINTIREAVEDGNIN